ncbi:1-(5-phosphoribosyl)-5-[(5-phosphoribosylamino)methylideneamino]imidazole-4-carboxamide isomerase [Blastopirellula sp. JC732]|uniref:1-(5-phosphoribosyl)-5-[(5-phosphoribosylamino)methylideneamino] imidazole-4-carboxamide isomerase n=1 Tax=Blastopirellula sediminis TaxID=2894196 RepID=A0A9X1MR91_9BACT|nr:1-(5-phosphoribosyl)-5-[(5-phosphoribosylamino)methylideneamino]imidazole-4-carboxamide isomerase [Blastopirellula sediminis]MCC9605284.1 1-(5-phosphoribosyl)-5-[(5-phosphoribosylamino)methylideneamino]imidazole-4-carboxamide isomerase [Blastopirellula sediminis]MCC9631416.1 1-(5-phosphoribosyl)-5-[(5-phosphoribosylamino)methylideneamino]imidazole-4-carboxamide isomerase [Blastopirellula sediminis]
MQIWPAIDLRGGKCVRLQQGDYNRETVFGDDPADMAKRWVEQGAECLHLVDLDGAKDGQVSNRNAIAAILAAVNIPCELGGGIRDEETIKTLLDLGMARLVIGSKAVREPDWFEEMCMRYPGKLALGIDARDGLAATDGWLETSNVSAITLAQKYEHLPIAAVIYTDIATDGMMSGPNVPAMAEMKASIRFPVVASGGVTTVEDVAQLAAAGLDGAIVGRTLYEGKMTVSAAVEAARAALL